ncbi:MAG: hypothetical protein R3F19_21510 [Verrucomicrobiales bacterium]
MRTTRDSFAAPLSGVRQREGLMLGVGAPVSIFLECRQVSGGVHRYVMPRTAFHEIWRSPFCNRSTSMSAHLR